VKNDPESYGVHSIFYGKYSTGGVFQKNLRLGDATTIGTATPQDFNHPLVGEYKLSSDGYRSNELDRDQEIVFSGCSQTFGVGIPDDYMWTNIVAKELGVSRYLNLATPGQSIQAIVANLFKYFARYGAPKSVAVLLPDPFRMLSGYNTDLAVPPMKEVSQRPTHGGVERLNLTHRADTPRFSQKPHNLLDVVPLETPLHLSITHMGFLIEYCKASNIKLVWASWHDESVELFDKVLRGMDPYFDLSSYISYITPYRDGVTDCHAKESTVAGDLFDFAADKKPNGMGHFGYHTNLHISSAFVDKFKEYRF
jgi:hypothetical protein